MSDDKTETLRDEAIFSRSHRSKWQWLRSALKCCYHCAVPPGSMERASTWMAISSYRRKGKGTVAVSVQPRKAEGALPILKTVYLMQRVGSEGIETNWQKEWSGHDGAQSSVSSRSCYCYQRRTGVDPKPTETLMPAAAADWNSGSHGPAKASVVCAHQQPFASAAVTSAPTLVGAHCHLLELRVEPGPANKKPKQTCMCLLPTNASHWQNPELSWQGSLENVVCGLDTEHARRSKRGWDPKHILRAQYCTRRCGYREEKSLYCWIQDTIGCKMYHSTMYH